MNIIKRADSFTWSSFFQYLQSLVSSSDFTFVAQINSEFPIVIILAWRVLFLHICASIIILICIFSFRLSSICRWIFEQKHLFNWSRFIRSVKLLLNVDPSVSFIIHSLLSSTKLLNPTSTGPIFISIFEFLINCLRRRTYLKTIVIIQCVFARKQMRQL